MTYLLDDFFWTVNRHSTLSFYCFNTILVCNNSLFHSSISTFFIPIFLISFSILHFPVIEKMYIQVQRLRKRTAHFLLIYFSFFECRAPIIKRADEGWTRPNSRLNICLGCVWLHKGADLTSACTSYSIFFNPQIRHSLSHHLIPFLHNVIRHSYFSHFINNPPPQMTFYTVN